MAESLHLRWFRRLARMAASYKGLLAGSVFFGAAGNLSSIGLLGFAAYAAAEIVGGDGLSVTAVAAAIICGLLRGVLRYGEHYLGHDIAFRLLFDIRKEIFSAVNRLAPAKIIDRRSGDICAAVMADVEYIETFFAHTLAPIAIGFIVPVVILSVLASINIFFTIAVLPFYLLMGLLVPALSFRSASSSGTEYRDKLSEINSMLIENLQGLRELMLFGREGRRLDEMLEAGRDCGRAYRKIRANEGVLAALIELVTGVSALVMITVSAVLVSGGVVCAGEAVSAVVIGMSSFGPLISLMFLSNSLVNTSAAAGRIFSLIDEEPEVSDISGEDGNGRSVIRDFSVDEVPAAECVDFVYPGTHKKILKSFNLSPVKGRISALKAESGRGKSTILYLMMRFFDPVSGRMIVEDEDLRRFELDELRSSISYFTQDTMLFNITVLENIRIARETASDEDVVDAAKRAGIHDFVAGLPDGYNTQAGENGSRFSSGERQRIGLARIFLQDNDVILLDEPVSNLDKENETLIMSNLRAAVIGKTVVLVSHRSSVITMADYILSI